MKAWRVSRHGGLDALEWTTLPDPVAGPGQARVRVEALGLNHLDLWVRKGVEGHRFPLPMIPGCDSVGVIDQAPAGSEWKVGDPVIVAPGIRCGKCAFCTRGDDALCADYGIFGETRDGAAAEFLVVPVDNLIRRPKEIAPEAAAALPIPFVTAWSMLHAKARLREGESVLVQAGGSGVSIAAIQMAKLAGAYVITTVGDDAKIEKAKKLGADHVINYRKEKLKDALKAHLASVGRRGVDVAIDHVGADTFADSFRALARGGRLVTCGATTGSLVQVDLKPLFFKNLSILGSTMGSKADLVKIVELVAAGKLRPVIDSTFPLAEYDHAQARLESRAAFGKVVVKA